MPQLEHGVRLEEGELCVRPAPCAVQCRTARRRIALVAHAVALRAAPDLYNNVLTADNHPEECDISTYYLDYHVWAAVVNVGVTAVLSVVFGLLDIGNTTDGLKMTHVEAHFGMGGEGELTLEKINEIMSEDGTREPVRDPIAVVCMLVAAALTTFSLPWYGEAYDSCDYDSLLRWEACDTADVDCKAMCDVADMSLAPPFPVPALMTAASACLTNPAVNCTCPLQGGWFTFVKGTTTAMIPVDPVANVSFSRTIASLSTGGGVVYEGTGNGKVCEGYDLTNGIPTWAFNVIICWVVGMFMVAFAWQRWGCIDDVKQKTARGSSAIIENAVFGASARDPPTLPNTVHAHANTHTHTHTHTHTRTVG